MEELEFLKFESPSLTTCYIKLLSQEQKKNKWDFQVQKYACRTQQF